MDNIIIKPNKTLVFGGKEYKCSLGPNGIGFDKKEGDGKTPAGTFPIRAVYYRPDRIMGLPTELPISPIAQDDGWSDDPNLPDYNTLVKLPYNGSHEKLWREDGIYDIIVVLGYNDDPPVPGKGSAIFMHIARPDYSPTHGCIALKREDLMQLLTKITPGTKIQIQENS